MKPNAEVKAKTSYQIVRFFKDDRKPRVMQRGLSLNEAKLHCYLIGSKGLGWFDGWREVGKRGRKRNDERL